MDINATIIGQFITFAILVWFTMKYVWPPLTKAMHDREKKIAAGLDAAERSKRELEMAEHKSFGIIREAKQQASQIIEQANLHSAQLVEEAKSQAKQESQRIVDMAQGDIDREVTQAKEALKKQFSSLAIAGAEKILQRHLDSAAHDALLNELAAEI
jgi:F-type H+-transporting ATPase subunit b